ncbi:unnamed protein product (macronuclear) [Paramecium tetraurelia]|uniref:Casein kinase I n=1 Tax=Paramecium tetraurelia TaxID=5888 RepID=A0DG34_PARTE|nr:uncharacterized protein GSPATT00002129001 [Paramecium tetraurelia]CAK82001.1 unnamed protein product [Paramecium tetraurelia]|eukprot:XP_001449398.1 hypothetical protein (macronuclear) [Paramecium tetraurelia strain d4-2]
MSQSSQNRVFMNRFVVKKKISSGAFGVVFLVFDKQTNQDAALKLEKEDNEEMRSLEREVEILKQLNDAEGTPKLIWCGNESEFNIMVIQLLGRDLSYFFRQQKKFSLKCTIQIAYECVNILKNIHNKNVVHRDLKPENILMSKDNDAIYIVDFGISKIYCIQGEHMPFKSDKTFMGTPRYASVAAHLGHEISRKDDLESLFYVILYFLRGSLPWQNLPVSESERTKAVGEIKQNIDLNELCINQPHELVEILLYLKSLNFLDQPNYQYILQLLNQIAENNQFLLDGIYDWTEGLMKSTKKFSSLESKKSFEFNKIKELSPGNLMKSSSKLSQQIIWTVNDQQQHPQVAPSSQRHLLLPPDPNKKPGQRTDLRHLSNSSSNSNVGTFSSMKMKYLPSQIEIEKPTFFPNWNKTDRQQESQYQDIMDENNEDTPLSQKYNIAILNQAFEFYNKRFNKFQEIAN